MDRQTSIIVAGVGGLIVVLLLCAGGLLLWGAFTAADTTEIAAADLTATSLVETSTAVAGGGETGEASATAEEMPPPDIEELPTATPLPTNPPTDTPVPTATAVPATDTPVPTATSPPPVVVPTNPPPPPPTNTPPPPPPPTQPPQDTFGISATEFSLQDRSNFTVGGQVWFQFTLANANSNPVEYGAIGVMPKKDGVDRPEWYQHSYGGTPGDAVPPNGFSHEDHIVLPEGGAYTLRLVICFASYNACLGGGPWITLSQEIGITISG